MMKMIKARVDGDPDPLVEKVLTKLGVDFRYASIEACPKCKHFACVCKTLEEHHESCLFRLAVTCAISIECDHGFDVCPTCDPCTCV
jgi:hypothetical protein